MKSKKITKAQKRVLDLLETGKWYDPEAMTFLGVYRLWYLYEKLYESGYLERELRQREPGDTLAARVTRYWVYRKLSLPDQY